MLPVTVLARLIFVVDPEQIGGDCEAVATGIGFTVTITVIGFPVHPLADGVTVYVTLPGALPVAVSVCAIELPDDAVAPVAPDWLTVHENEVPMTLLVSAIEVAVPEHTDCDGGVVMTSGIGLTVTTIVNVEPEHIPAVGVTVYVTVAAE